MAEVDPDAATLFGDKAFLRWGRAKRGQHETSPPELGSSELDAAYDRLAAVYDVRRTPNEDELLETVRLQAPRPDEEDLDPTVALRRQLLAGELPLAIAWRWPGRDADGSLRQLGLETIRRGWDDLLDEGGLPDAGVRAMLGPLLGCWTRAVLLAAHQSDTSARVDRVRFEGFVRHALRLARGDGSLLFGPSGNGVALLAAAVRASGETVSATALRCLFERETPTAEATPPLVAHSELCETAVMRASWSRRPLHFGVAFPEGRVFLELHHAGVPLLDGEWSFRLALDDRPLVPHAPANDTCWYTDSDVDYLELEVPLGDGWRLQRQMMLSRKDAFLFLADAVLGPAPAAVTYSTTLPLADGLTFRGADETRDGVWLRERDPAKPVATLLPLALPEWRSERSFGELSADPAGTTLRLSATAARLYAPLWLDLDSRRARKPLTWRRLTVAERHAIVGADVAAGYRVQIDRQQWLVYRALASCASRSVLGQHLTEEFCLARFVRDGTLETLVTVEPADSPPR